MKELDKALEAHDRLGLGHVFAFTEWLSNNGYVICERNPESPEYAPYMPIRKTMKQLFHEYAEIDSDQHERELRDLLDEIREANRRAEELR